ncbi:MAG TPA: YceI family protein [Pirellulales bacterium]|nr:YceI family protein [Pirellulales bacterium]
MTTNGSPARRAAGFATWALLAGLVISGAPSAGAEDQPRDGDIQLDSSRVYIFVGKTGLGHEHAVAGKLKSGEVHLGASRLAGELVFDMSTFTADTYEAREYFGMEGTVPEGRRKEVTDNMTGAQVLDVHKHPTATFKIASALPLNRKSGDGNPMYRLDGEFTLHGVKRPLKIDAEIAEQDEGLRLIGSFKIKQTDYGIRPFSKAFGAVGVTDELTIHGDLVVAATRTAQNRAAKRK